MDKLFLHKQSLPEKSGVSGLIRMYPVLLRWGFVYLCQQSLESSLTPLAPPPAPSHVDIGEAEASFGTSRNHGEWLRGLGLWVYDYFSSQGRIHHDIIRCSFLNQQMNN